MKIKKITRYILLATCVLVMYSRYGCVSCTKWKVQKPQGQYHQSLVVDGVIETGAFPLVYLTSTTRFESVIDSSQYYNVVMTRAKVTVRTDDETEILMLMRDMRNFPPHYYRGTRLRGKAGKTYHLEVILSGDTLRSTTTIPAPPVLKNLWFEKDRNDSTRGLLWIGFDDPAATHDFYRVQTRVLNKEPRFTATHLSVVEDELFNGTYIEFPLYHGYTSNANKTIDFRYETNDTVQVKFGSIDQQSHAFWASFESEMLNSSNPFGSGGKNLKTNISGGMGVWCGYATVLRTYITR